MDARTAGAAVTVWASVLVVAGCGTATSGDPPAGPRSGVTVREVHADVPFYPACGNEVLELDGTTWYQLYRDERRALDAELDGGTAGGAQALMVVTDVSAPRVVAPGPGDDVGDVTVFSDGFARFESDSGDLSTWLTTEVRTYNWVC